MSLRTKQSIFTYHVSRLIQWAYENGYELTFGEAYRTQEQAALNAERGVGIANSLHCDRLAVDFNLFDGATGEFLTSTEDHRPLGEYWESLDPENSWGGHFNDGNHYSRKHGGRR